MNDRKRIYVYIHVFSTYRAVRTRIDAKGRRRHQPCIRSVTLHFAIYTFVNLAVIRFRCNGSDVVSLNRMNMSRHDDPYRTTTTLNNGSNDEERTLKDRTHVRPTLTSAETVAQIAHTHKFYFTNNTYAARLNADKHAHRSVKLYMYAFLLT